MKSILAGVLTGALTPFFCLAQAGQERNEPSPTPLTLEEVRCQGNTSTSCPFISGHLYLSPGDPIDEEEIRNAKLRLSALSNFKSVHVRLEKGLEKDRAIVVIEVSEASPIATEIAVGTSLRNSGLSQNLAGRVSHQNVFGTGKIVDLEVGGRIPLDEPTQRDFSTRLRYIDPKLFGSQKYFLVGGIFFQDSLYESKDGDSYSTEQLGVDLSLGRRIWDFSYVMAGYQHRPISEITDHIVGPDWAIETRSDAHERVYHLGYGWNSEDDAYFPTRGSRFNTTLTWSSSDHHSVLFKTGLAYRTTWSTAKGTVWTFQFGGTPRTEYRPSLDEDLAVSLAYARPLAASDALGGIERGRWYIEPGFYSLGYSSYQGVAADAGLKAGVRLESQSLGIIDLYAIATSDLSIGGDR